jgi:type IV pilus assembly protein PilQ
MRLKQLLGVIATLLLLTMLAAGAGSQLTNVSATSQSGVTTVTVQTNGAFSHNEYRPADTLLLVDLTGVSAGKLNERQSALEGPGVKSYRVLTYKGANGAEVTRLELVLADGAQFKVMEARGALNIRVGSKEALAAAPAVEAKPSIAKAESKPAVAKVESKPIVKPEPKQMAKAEPKASQSAPSSVATISKVTVAQGSDGLDVEVNGAPNAKAMRLTGPDRIVLDVPNSLPAQSAHNVPVNNGDVKAVRVGRFQEEPPTTRIVIDLAGSRNFEIIPGDNKFTVHVHASTTAAPKTDPKPMKKVDPTPVMAKAQPATTAPVTTPKQQELKAATFASTAAYAQPATPTQPASAQLQNVSMTKPATAAPVNTTPAASSAPAKAETSVFVEPTFKAKESDSKSDDPAERASGAASVIASSAAHANDALLPKVNGALQASVPAVNAALQQQQQAPAAAARPQYTGEPISVNLKDVDLKDFFRLIHEISGLNIVLDPNVKGSLTIVLDDVPWDQALQIVLQNNALDKQLEGNVLRIATVDTFRREAEGKRAQEEAQALAVSKQTVTRFLSYAHSKDVVPTIKRFLTARGDVISDDRTNALIIQDIPAVIPEIDRLLVQLDRKTQEVEIEARVVAATRNFARDIGMQLGFGWGNGVSAAGGSAANSGLINAVPGSQYFTNGGSIPLFSNLAVPSPTSGLIFSNATRNYRIDAILTMAESRGLLKILSRPRIVTQNNITALVRQGFRIPVVTQAQLGGPPTVSYVDAFLRLTVTPQITVENTIFLAVDVENTTPDFGRTVQGNPTLVTQQATTQVLVTDGGTVVIGGVIQTQNNLNVNQVPLLGDLPILGNLFKRRTVTTTTQELIFFLSPKIIQT